MVSPCNFCSAAGVGGWSEEVNFFEKPVVVVVGKGVIWVKEGGKKGGALLLLVVLEFSNHGCCCCCCPSKQSFSKTVPRVSSAYLIMPTHSTCPRAARVLAAA